MKNKVMMIKTRLKIGETKASISRLRNKRGVQEVMRNSSNNQTKSLEVTKNSSNDQIELLFKLVLNKTIISPPKYRIEGYLFITKYNRLDLTLGIDRIWLDGFFFPQKIAILLSSMYLSSNYDSKFNVMVPCFFFFLFGFMCNFLYNIKATNDIIHFLS